MPVISGYIISRDSDYGYATVPASAYSWVDPNSDGHAHSYQVRAYAASAASHTVAWVSAPSPTTTEPPRNLYQAGQGQVCWDPVLGHNGAR